MGAGASVIDFIQMKLTRGKGVKLTFTTLEKKEIMKTWEKVSTDMASNGIKIFIRVFETQPAVRDIFGVSNIANVQDLERDAKLRDHAIRIMQAIGALVENLDDLERQLSRLFIELGGRHVTLANFKPQYFALLKDATIQVWRTEMTGAWTSKMELLWETLLNFVIYHVTTGCKDEAKVRKRAEKTKKKEDAEMEAAKAEDAAAAAEAAAKAGPTSKAARKEKEKAEREKVKKAETIEKKEAVGGKKDEKKESTEEKGMKKSESLQTHPDDEKKRKKKGSVTRGRKSDDARPSSEMPKVAA